MNKKNAFMLRMNFKEDMNLLEEYEDLIIGWSNARGLLDKNLSRKEFREIIYQTHYSDDDNYRRAGQAAGCLWRFIREMKEGDLVVVPHENKNEFYIAEVAGPPVYEKKFAKEGTAYRRKDTKWLNDKQPIKREYARAALQSKMKARQTCVNANDVIEEIKEVLNRVKKGEKPDFTNDLREKLIDKTRKELYRGVLNPTKFEKLIKNLLISLGGENVKVTGGAHDFGADIVTDFSIANTFNYKLAVQAKHYDTRKPISKEPINQLIEGMEAENASIGWVVTPGEFSEEAINYHQEIDYQIELIDGIQLATIIVEEGINMFDEL